MILRKAFRNRHHRQDEEVAEKKEAVSEDNLTPDTVTEGDGEDNLELSVREVIERILSELEVEPDSLTVNAKEGAVDIQIEASNDDAGILIGKRGRTLDALRQVLFQVIVNNSDAERKRLTIDINDYRANRQDYLAREADRLVEQVLDTQRAASFDAMSSSDRRIVHEHLKDVAGIQTHSEGRDPDRYVVVSPA